MASEKGLWRIFTVWLAVALLCSVLPSTVCGAPADAAEEAKGLVGLYQGDTGRFLVREREGALELLYDVAPGADEVVKSYAAFPLQRIAGDVYRLFETGPLGSRKALVRFERDAEGRVVACQAGERRFARKFYGPDRGLTFRIQPLLPIAELKIRAAAASPPAEKGDFRRPDLVEITALEPAIKLDIRYATDNNFMGVALYDEPRAFLQRPAAEALARVHRKLAGYGYGLVVHDAYRPWYVTKMFWDATPDSQKVFVADPAKGSRHNRGGAVDVALYDRKTGRLVPMISGYDEFSPRAYADYPGGTGLDRWRRDLLRILLEGEGFTVYPEEWWHFDYQGWEHFPILNLSFSELRGL